MAVPNAQQSFSIRVTSEYAKQHRKKAKTSVFARILRYLRECIAIAIWLLVFTKVFVYDIDLLLISRFPLLTRLYPFKFFFLITLASVIWLTLGTRRFFKSAGYIALYPIGPLPWRLVKSLFKNWPLLLVFLPAIESVVRSMKSRFVLGSFTVLAALAICLSRRPPIVLTCMGWLLVYLAYHYVLRLRTAFRANTLFARIAPSIERMWKESIQSYRGEEFKALSGPDSNPSEYPKKHIKNIRDLYTQNLMWGYVAAKLQTAVSARHTDVYFIVALIHSFALTLLIFAFEYFGLFKLFPSSFSHGENVSFWSFFLFSFNAMLRAGFTTVGPVSTLAMLLANLELLASAIIGLCLVFILLTSSRERYRQEVKDVADKLAISAREIERFLQNSLRMRLVDAEAKIIGEDPSFANLLISFGRTPPEIKGDPQGKDSIV